MGNTTIIEINHDRLDEIEKHPELFVSQILEQGRAGRAYIQQIEGGHIITFFPRRDDNKEYAAWIRWKKRWVIK